MAALGCPLRDGITLPQFGPVTITYAIANESIDTNRITTGGAHTDLVDPRNGVW